MKAGKRRCEGQKRYVKNTKKAFHADLNFAEGLFIFLLRVIRALFVAFVSCFRAFQVFIRVDLLPSAVPERLLLQPLLQ
jgi:hypothetical protein